MPRQRGEVVEVRDAEVDEAEALLLAASETAMQEFLRRLRVAASKAVGRYGDARALTAAALPSVPFEAFGSGEALQWWADSVDESLIPAFEAVWQSAFLKETGVSSGLDFVPAYLAQVRDRLVPGEGTPALSPSIPEDAFEMARGVINRALATGDSPAGLARALSATFSWDHDQPYWEALKAQADRQIDEILDPIGPPGDPARELAKRTNPVVKALQQDRNLAQSRIDSAQSTWQARAKRIARTESTGALNAGAYAAYLAEGVEALEWVATTDGRTRPSHAAADGQVVAIGFPFSVGGASLRFPGDPTAPASQVVNCRCTTVAVPLPK
jgi:SPP1 gp7 family putative phage head morphogenesis protein